MSRSSALSVRQILLCGSLVVALTMGIRHGFGLWLQPMVTDMGWVRQDFSFALAVQNLSWGVFGVFAGMLADRWGGTRVLMVGGLCYALGLFGMAVSPTPGWLVVTAGLLIGAAQAGSTYAVVYGIIGRQIPAERRSWAMGVTASAGSFGQFLLVPIEGQLIFHLGWQTALYVLAMLVLLVWPLALALREPRPAGGVVRRQSIGAAVSEAFSHRGFVLLMSGYFVCGFQVVFIGVHLPSYLRDMNQSPLVASYALALIGLFNVFGTYIAGQLGQRMARRYILAFIYAARSLVIVLFLMAPLSPLSVYLFAAAMGLLWLSTVPPTNTIVAGIFGVAHLSMLSGFVFFSHQVGSFLGVWLGGFLYDRTGSYDVVWYIAIALGVASALINLAVDERPIARPALA